MAISYTANGKLQKPDFNNRNWHIPVNANMDTFDAVKPITALQVTLHEVPSTTLTVAVAAGGFLASDNSKGTCAGSASFAIPTATTQKMWLTNAGVITIGTGWPATAHVPLATIVADATTITSITDERITLATTTDSGALLQSGGTMIEGATIAIGTVTGLKIGTAVNQKIGHYGSTPVVQPTGGVAAASGSYTATEQGMINRMYVALQALGLMS